MPLAMKRQINDQESRASPTQTWIALEKLVQLPSFTFLQCTSSIEDHFEPW